MKQGALLGAPYFVIGIILLEIFGGLHHCDQDDI
jgi:hypothetical protein